MTHFEPVEECFNSWGIALFKVLGWLWALDGSREREWAENTRARGFLLGLS